MAGSLFNFKKYLQTIYLEKFSTRVYQVNISFAPQFPECYIFLNVLEMSQD